jgi:hypothetical protein
VLRVEQDGETLHQAATLGLLRWRTPDESRLEFLIDKIFERHEGKENVAQIVKDMGNGRNKLMYATDTGFLTGPQDLEYYLREMAKTTIGVLWAAVDIAEHDGECAQIVEAILQTTVELKKVAFPSEKKCSA